MSLYCWDGTGPVPDHLRAIAWMDGAHGQMKLITSEENLKEEEEMKITSTKHSAARTGSEQSADVGPNFKLVKKNFKTREVQHENTNPIVTIVKELLVRLENNVEGDVVRLKSHKKKAILFALPNLPEVTGLAYTVPNVRKGFIYNGQLDVETTSVPSFRNLINTYRGDVTEGCLSNKKKLMENFFEEMYMTGTILESTFDRFKIPKDTDSSNKVVEKTNDISIENRHRAKILSSKVQINERRKLVNKERMKEYTLKKKAYDAEQKDVTLNKRCEEKFIKIITKSFADRSDNTPIPADIHQCTEYSSVQGHLTLALLNSNMTSVLNSELKAFVKLRSTRLVKKGRICYSNVPNQKDLLIKKCVDLRSSPRLECVFSCPALPSLLSIEDI